MYRPSQRKYKFKPYFTSGSPYNSWDEFVEANEKLDCNNPACTKKRHHRGKFCCRCSMYYTLLGDPRYRPVRTFHYKEYTKLAKEMIAFNKANIIVTDFVEKWQTLADQGRQELSIEFPTWWAEIYKVLNHESNYVRVNPLDILADFVGLYMFSQYTGTDYIRNDKMWLVALSDIGLRGVKSKVKPIAAGKRLHKFAKFLWGTYSIYILKIGHSTMHNEKLKVIRDKQLKEAELQLPMEKGEI